MSRRSKCSSPHTGLGDSPGRVKPEPGLPAYLLTAPGTLQSVWQPPRPLVKEHRHLPPACKEVGGAPGPRRQLRGRAREAPSHLLSKGTSQALAGRGARPGKALPEPGPAEAAPPRARPLPTSLGAGAPRTGAVLPSPPGPVAGPRPPSPQPLPGQPARAASCARPGGGARSRAGSTRCPPAPEPAQGTQWGSASPCHVQPLPLAPGSCAWRPQGWRGARVPQHAGGCSAAHTAALGPGPAPALRSVMPSVCAEGHTRPVLAPAWSSRDRGWPQLHSRSLSLPGCVSWRSPAKQHANVHVRPQEGPPGDVELTDVTAQRAPRVKLASSLQVLYAVKRPAFRVDIGVDWRGAVTPPLFLLHPN